LPEGIEYVDEYHESVKNIRTGAEEQGSMNTSAQLLDRATILDRVGGDEDLLREITAIFLEEYPSLIEEIHIAVTAHDAKRLERAAHSLKGSVSNFGARAATEAAYTLETLGRRGEMQNAGSALDHLVSQFEQLQPALEHLAS
jgi:HPt (histidine-containing phosphotransfer) domain-containing protein